MMSQVDPRRAALAGLVGAVGAAVIYVCLYALNNIPYSGEGSTGFYGALFTWTDVVRALLLLLMYIAAFGISGALPARIFDASWFRSFFSSVFGHVVAASGSAAFVVFFDFPVQERRVLVGALILVVGIALTLIIATRTISWAFLTVALAVAGVSFLLAPSLGGFVGLSAWIILPAVFALIRPERA